MEQYYFCLGIKEEGYVFVFINSSSDKHCYTVY